MNIISTIAGLGLLSYLEYIAHVFLLILKPFGIVSYKFSYERELHSRAVSIILKECLCTGEAIMRGGKKFPNGYFANFKMVGYVDADISGVGSYSRIFILTTEKQFSYLTENTDPPVLNNFIDHAIISVSEPPSKIKVFHRYGRYEDLGYAGVSIDLRNLNPFETQRPIVDQIINIFKERGMVRVFIEGPPCCGKSSIGYCVSKELKAVFTHSFNPTDPGDAFGNLINVMNYENEDTPKVIVLEEADIMINNIHNKSVVQNPKISTTVRDKSSWTTFLDDIVFYRNVILILTSNTSKKEIDKLDTAYVRKGRIDLFYKMDTPILL